MFVLYYMYCTLIWIRVSAVCMVVCFSVCFVCGCSWAWALVCILYMCKCRGNSPYLCWILSLHFIFLILHCVASKSCAGTKNVLYYILIYNFAEYGLLQLWKARHCCAAFSHQRCCVAGGKPAGACQLHGACMPLSDLYHNNEDNHGDAVRPIWTVGYALPLSSVAPPCFRPRTQDEPFHVPQTQQYCAGRFKAWDPKITTFPGLYLLSTAVLRSLAWVAQHLPLRIAQPFSADDVRLLAMCLQSVILFTLL